MASFTDQIMQFRPYVQQLPVEAMAQVGMYKQQKYEEGVQKVQSYVDQVAGLPVMRNVDKQYLQSKLNELGNRLKTVAAGDFSNFQLVNSIGGMTGQIIKDPIISSAVQSTSNYRSQLQMMDDDRKSGKLDPSNEYKFTKRFSEYMNSTKPGELFSERYIPHFDVFKFAKETFDAVKPDGFSFDQVYLTTADGRIKTDERGNPIYSPVMVRMEKEGRFPEKVKTTLNQIFSDPRVSQQLQISGEYNFRGLSPNQLGAIADRSRFSLLERLNDKLATLMLERNTGKDVQNQIDEVNLEIENVSTKYNEYKQLSLQNPDAVRGAMYKDDVLSRYTTMFTDVKTKNQTLNNPGWDANFKLMEEANQNRRFREQMDFNYEKERWDRQFKVMELESKSKKFGLGGFGTIQDFQTSDPAVYVAQFEQSYSNAADRYNGAADDMIFNLALNTPKNQGEISRLINGGMSREQAMNTLISNSAKQNGESVDQFRSRWLQKSIEKINQMDPVKLQQDPMLQGMYNSFSAAKQDFINLDNTKKQIESKLDKNLIKSLDASQMGKALKDLQVTIEGRPVKITGEDLWNAAIYAKGNQSSIGFLNSPALREQAKIAEAKLKQSGKDFLLNFALERAIVPEGLPPLTTAIRGVKGVVRNIFGDEISGKENLITQLNKAYNLLDDDVIKNAAAAKSQALMSSGFSVSPNLRMQVLTGDTDTDRNIMNFIGNTAGAYATNKQNLSADFSGEAIMTVLGDKNNFKPFELKTSRNDATGEVFPELVFYDAAGERVAGMSITAEEAGKLGVNTNTLYEAPGIRNIRTRINANPIKSTSFGDPKDVYTYLQGDVLFEKNDMPKLAGTPYDVKANIKEADGAYYGILYVNDGRSKPKIRVLPATQDVGEAIQKLQSASPQLITAILNEK